MGNLNLLQAVYLKTKCFALKKEESGGGKILGGGDKLGGAKFRGSHHRKAHRGNKKKISTVS